MRVPIQLGRCKYCGKEVALEAETRHDADEEVTEHCNCSGALRHRRFEKAYESLDFLEADLKKTDSMAVKAIQKMRTDLRKLEQVAI